MASSNVRRKMSYRKPVPEYVPTPPGSPAPATLPAMDLDLAQVTDDLLSLPPTWSHSRTHSPPNEGHQLVVPSMFSGAPSTGTANSSRYTPPPLFIQGSSSRESLSREASTQGADHEVYGPDDRATSPDRKRRKLHREYRPPTPPLPALHKRRRLTVSALPDEKAEISQGDTSMNFEFQQVDNIVDDRERSLRLTPSFTTERTFVSLGASHPVGDTSMTSGWSGGLTTFVSESDPRLSHYPLPLYKPKAMREPGLEDEHKDTRWEAPPTGTWSSWLRESLAAYSPLSYVIAVDPRALQRRIDACSVITFGDHPFKTLPCDNSS
ncbi:hypothetical protein NMY22_g3699 [Coprinellus aureogranulatus]|nr:hypothetical protein NMY22_g3699 [Coprinellus aureogranulatus]